MSEFVLESNYHYYAPPMTHKEIAEHQKALECKAVTHVIDLIKSLKLFTKSEALLMIIKMFLDIQYIDIVAHPNQNRCEQCADISEINLCIKMLQYNSFQTMLICNNFSEFLVNEALQKTKKSDTVDELVFDFVTNVKELQINYAKSILKNNQEIMVTTEQVKHLQKVIIEELYHPNYQPMIVQMCAHLEVDPKKGVNQFPLLVHKLEQYHIVHMNDKVSELSVQFRFLKNKIREYYAKVPFSLLFHVKAIELVFDKFRQKYFDSPV